MEASYRRDWMKKMVTGLAVFASGTSSSPASQHEKQSGSCCGESEFWQRMDEIQARDLVASAINAARAEIESSREYNASKRAAILLGSDAGREHAMRAEMHYRIRTAELGNTKQALARFVKNAGDSGSSRFAEFVGQGGLKKLAADARQTGILSMLNSDISPEEAQSAARALDARLAKIQEMSSFDGITSFLDHHLDELIARKIGDVDPNGLCVLILILTSIFAVLVVIAALICVFTLGLGCQGILDQLLAQACP